ncbi:MAG TPA: NUDIX domain-containing protein [Verrucomicrobiae bacterium]|nr:NUDIX domain-containing protein [Verrucomicrobiae bacterium]
MSLRHRASLVLIKNGSILLVRRENERGLYYIFPGGGVNEGESVEQAVVRETMEEAGMEVEARYVLADIVSDYDHNTLVVCHQLDDTEPEWQEKEKQTAEDAYLFEWVPLTEISQLNLLPKEGSEAVRHAFL